MRLRKPKSTDAQPVVRASFLARSMQKRRDGEGGYILMFSAIVMIPLLAIAGMATDVGSWYSSANKIQKAADAAALAGVVWLPDLAVATRVALDTAQENGYDDDDPDITVVVSRVNSSELRVQITDLKNDVYFSSFFLDNVEIMRESVAQYILPVPLGSPKNYFGTGNLAPTPEGFWASINGWCTPKEQGDPFAVAFEGNWPSSGMTCPGGTANGSYIADDDPQYTYVIDLPEDRPSSVVIHILSPMQNGAYPDNAGTTPITTRFKLTSPDSTPFNDEDNPTTTCTGSGESNPRSYAPNTTDNDKTIFSQSGWSQFCTIPTTAPAGTYLLGVDNLDNEANSSGTNQYSIMASYNGLGVVCDSRSDDMCPAVHGKEWISILANSTSSNADFFLAEVGPEHAGKQMEITLFDPGEGGDYISIKDPDGGFVEFDWRTQDNHYSGSNTTKLDVSGCSSMPQVGTGRNSGCKFNERYVILTIDLPSDYDTSFSTYWWKVNYKFQSTVTDRSTWSVRILGDPVHLSH